MLKKALGYHSHSKFLFFRSFCPCKASFSFLRATSLTDSNENSNLNSNNKFFFSKSAASKLKVNKSKYEESENALNDIMAIFEPSDEEGVSLSDKDESDNDISERGSTRDKMNYHFIAEKDPAKAALNLQNFIMKTSEKLSATNLREFLHTVESFKPRLTTADYRQHKIIKNRLFLKKCVRIFEKG